jgi:peptide/nickel transport system substrate-binding protein
MRVLSGHRVLQPLGKLSVLVISVPLLVSACGGSTATNAPSAQATAAGGASATTAAGAATQPASSAVSSTSSTAAVGSTTASGTTAPGTASGTTAATTGGDPRGTAPTKRGGGGTLHVLYWQAPTILNFHLAHGTKDDDASRVVEEPLATLSINAATPDIPVLAKEIPSTANGELSADGTSVTWKLKDGVKWSDGTPFTSADVKATWQYIIKPENGATDLATFLPIASIDTPDATTAKITFKAPTATWYFPFAAGGTPVLQKAQVDTCTDKANCIVNTAPIGTGPYKVKSFTSGDNVQYVINENYREANAPFFDAVDWKGGGDAGTAAKAVQSGQADFAWNLQVDPATLKQMTDAGAKLNVTPGGGVEKILVNFSDPRTDVNGEKSSPQSKNPFFSDPLVRQAVSYLIDRDSIAKNLYGPAGNATCNILPSVPPQTVSKNTHCSYDVAKANQLLDQAGWAKGSDGIRAKNGVKFAITFASTVNPIREKEEQVMKQSFQQAGIQMDIQNADSGVFFGQPDNPDADARFLHDLEMYTSSPTVPDAGDWFRNWTTSQIAQKSNNWSLPNYTRFSDPQYDALVDQLAKELTPEKRAQLQIQANDYIVNHWVEIPIVDRNSVDGRRADLINTNPTPWDYAAWNIAYWQIKK